MVALRALEQSNDMVNAAVDANRVGGKSRLFGAAILYDDRGCVLAPQAALRGGVKLTPPVSPGWNSV